MIVQYFQFLPIFKNHILLYKAFIILIVVLIYSTFLLMGTMAFRIRYRKIKILWPINLLKISLPIISYFFFGQIFIVLTSIFYCRKEEIYESPYLHCLEGIWIYSMKPAAIIGIIIQVFIGFVTNSLYFTQYFEKNKSDILKRFDTFPDVVFMFMKVSIMFLFISDKGYESEHWAMLIFLVFITGLNAYANFFYGNRKNIILKQLNNFFSLITFLSYLNLLIGKIFLFFHFNGLIYLFICDLILFFLYLYFYKRDNFYIINVNFQTLNNAKDILNYISSYYEIITDLNRKRNSFFIFHSMMTKIEEKCYNNECPLKKYLLNLSKGVEYDYLLIEYCDKLFQHGLSKFQDDVNLKYHYTIFLIEQMNNKKKANIVLNSLKYKLISFKANYDFYRCQHFLENHDFQVQKKNFIIFKYRSNVLNLKNLISKVILSQYEFLTFIYGSKTKRDDNFKKIYELGSNILNYIKEIDKLFNELIIEKTNNIEIINLYSDFVEKILEDEDKLKKCQEMKKIIFNSNFHFYEKDFSNFDMRFLKDKDSFSYMIISAHHKSLGIIKDCSKSLVNIFGYEKKELLGKHINILIPEMFHDKHDYILKKASDNQKLNFLENSYKRKVYIPDFMEKSVYGLSRAKFLIPIKLFIYLINTEENELVYVVEIYRQIPTMNDILSNKIPCTVLTNENFIIQTFTPNCMAYLKLKDNHISNYDIINNIKEFHDDYIIDINTTHLSRNVTMKESSIINHKKHRSNLNLPHIKKTVKTDILNKYYFKKSRITWLVNKKKKTQLKNINEKRRSSSFNFGFKKIRDKNDEEVIIEIELDMEIKKIILENDLIGYYFFFTSTKQESKLENNKVKFIEQPNDNHHTILKLSGVLPIAEYLKQRHSVVDELNRKPILSEPTSFESNKDNNNPIKRKRKSCAEYNLEDDLIGPDYICKSPCNFMFDINSMSYLFSNERNNLKKMNDGLKRDVVTKIKINQFQFNSLKNRTKIFSLSQIRNHGSTEIIANSSSSGSFSNSKNSSSYTSSLESSEESNDSFVLRKKRESNFKLGLIKRNSKTVMTEIKKSTKSLPQEVDIDLNTNAYLKILNKNDVITQLNKINESMEFINSYYKVNIEKEKYHFLIFDYYKEIFVEKKNFERISKVETILKQIKKNYSSFLDEDEKYPSLLFENENIIKRDEKEKQMEEKKKEEKKMLIINEEKILEKKIKYAINREKDEAPIIRLKIYSVLFFVVLIILLIIIYSYYVSYLSKINKILTLIKDIVKIKFCNRMSVFFVGESTLLYFNADKIVGGVFDNFPDKKENKKLYIKLMRDKIKETFIESELCFEEILSTKITFSKNTTKFLEEKNLDTHYILKNGSIESLIADIFTTLMQYNGAFYNLAFSPLDLEQNHTDILNFLHNSFNDYVRGINLLISIYREEMDELSKSIYLYWILSLIIFFFIYVLNFLIIIHYYIKGYHKRTSYLEVFYELNENVLKILISNCEDLFKKVKLSELKADDDSNYDENLDKKVYFMFKEKQNKRNSTFLSRNQKIVSKPKSQKKLPKQIKHFMKFFGFCLLITFLYFIYNTISCINLVEDAKYISEYLDISQHFQTVMIDLFVAYRQYIFDDSIIIYNMMPFDYLSTTLNKTYETVTSDTIFIKNFNKKYLFEGEVHELLTQSFCYYNYTNRFSSYEECKNELYFLLNYDFTIIAANFLEALRKSKFVVKYLLSTGKIVGGLNDYDQNTWLKDERVPIIGRNNTGNYIFRLDLYNDETVHGYLDLIFVNILLPYIDINRKHIIPYLTVNKRDYYLRLTTTFYIIFVVLIFGFYLLLKIKFLNKHIYRTKILLRLIPLNILASLGHKTYH